MIKPEDKQRVTLRDLKRCQMASNFFNVLFNLNKFTAMEQKDPFLSRGEEPESYVPGAGVVGLVELVGWVGWVVEGRGGPSDVASSMVSLSLFSDVLARDGDLTAHPLALVCVSYVCRDWDRFARIEYDRLSAEDDTGGEVMDDDEGWQQGFGGTREAPF